MSNSSSDNKGGRPPIAPPGSARGAAAGGGRPAIAPPGSAASSRSGGNAPDWSVLRRQRELGRADRGDEAAAKPAPPTRPTPAPIDNRTRRAKNLSGNVAGGSSSAAAQAETRLRSAVSVVLITRNHETLVSQRLQQLRGRITSIDTRWATLDLGSVDRSAAVAQQARAHVIFAPGGRVRPMQSLDLALAGCGGEIIVLLDAACRPGEGLDRLIDGVRRGCPLVVPHVRSPGVVAVRRTAWEARGFEGNYDLIEWAKAGGGAQRIEVQGTSIPRTGNLVPLVVGSGPLHFLGRALWSLYRALSPKA